MSILADIAAVRTQLNEDIIANGNGDITGSLLNQNLIDMLDTLEAKLVTSWNTRTGTVSPAASDYDASQIDNDSSVAGSFVHDALNNLLTLAKTEAIGIALGAEDGDLAVGTSTVTFRMPYAFTVTDVRANVVTAPTGSGITIDINDSGTTILSTKLTIDATEKTSTTAATPPVISDSSLTDDAEITIDIDAVGSTIAGAGGKIWLIGTRA